jgi:hypothetical protein
MGYSNFFAGAWGGTGSPIAFALLYSKYFFLAFSFFFY